MKSRHFWGIIIALLILVGLSLWSNIINIGEALGESSKVLSVVFYILTIGVVIAFIVLPLLRTVLTPEIKKSPDVDVYSLSAPELIKYIKRLNLTSEERKLMDSSMNSYDAVVEIVKNRQQRVHDIVQESALDVFLITSLSQNGGVDVLGSLAVNFKLINKIIKQVGFRPTLWQLLKLYTSVISTSLIITAVDDVLDNINLGDMLGAVGKVLLKSAANGAMNAFVCLRVGYATVKYLEVGNKEFNERHNEITKQIVSQSKKALPSVIKNGVVKGFKSIKKTVIGEDELVGVQE